MSDVGSSTLMKLRNLASVSPLPVVSFLPGAPVGKSELGGVCPGRGARGSFAARARAGAHGAGGAEHAAPRVLQRQEGEEGTRRGRRGGSGGRPTSLEGRTKDFPALKLLGSDR